jgi:hypothetical protein
VGTLSGAAAADAADAFRERCRCAARLITIDGVCSMVLGSLEGGPFLTAFALALGASTYEIGLLASIAFLSQPSSPRRRSWNFARRRAAPFVALYMLNLLALPLWMVRALLVTSQITNILFLQVGGAPGRSLFQPMRAHHDGPDTSSGSWPGPSRRCRSAYFLTVPLLVSIHVVSDMSTAGIGIIIGNMGLTPDAAPRRHRVA